VTYGWQLTANNTGLAGAGVDRSSLPVYNGPIRAGMTISEKTLVDTVDLSKVPNVTLDRVLITAQGARNGLILGPGSVVKDSDIDGSVGQQGERIGIFGDVPAGSSYSIQRVRVTGMTVGVWLDGNGSGSMTDTYVHDLLSIGGAHVDGFTRRSGTGSLSIARSRIDASGDNVTGAFFLQDTWGDAVGGIALSDSYLEGEGYVMSLHNQGAGVSLAVDNVRTRPIGWGEVNTLQTDVTITTWARVSRYNGTRLPEAVGRTVRRP